MPVQRSDMKGIVITFHIRVSALSLVAYGQYESRSRRAGTTVFAVNVLVRSCCMTKRSVDARNEAVHTFHIGPFRTSCMACLKAKRSNPARSVLHGVRMRVFIWRANARFANSRWTRLGVNWAQHRHFFFILL
jgi:hypothetical protein